MIDVGLAATTRRWQPEARKARIAHVAQIGRRHGVRAEAEEAVGAALEAVGDLLAAAANFDQVVAIARALEQLELLVNAAARERITRRIEQREQLAATYFRNRQVGD